MMKTERYQIKLLVLRSENDISFPFSKEYEILIFMISLILTKDYDNKAIL